MRCSGQSKRLVENAPSANEGVWRSIRYVLVTVVLMLGAYHFAASVPGVSFVWALSGSTLGLLLGYTMPVVFYLKVSNLSIRGARTILSGCVVGSGA